MSVRALMLLVLIVGGGLGWTIDRANRQQRIVAWFLRSGGSVEYDSREPWAPRWLVDRVGIDYFQRVATVVFQPQSEDQAGAAVAVLRVLGPPPIVVLHGPLFVERLVGRLDELDGIECLALVSLPRNSTTKAGLASLSRLRRLRALGIICSGIGDDGLEVIKALKQLEHLKGRRQLKCLNLRGTKMSDVGLEHLKEFKNLEKLWLDGTRVSDAGKEKLKLDLPNIAFDPGYPTCFSSDPVWPMCFSPR